MWTREEAIVQVLEVRRMPFGLASRARLEQIVKRIEQEGGPLEVLPMALLDLVEQYTFGPTSPLSFPTMSKVLRLYDQHPELFDDADLHNLFWELSWVKSDAIAYPVVSKEQVEAFLAQMKERFALSPYGMVAVDRAYWDWAKHRGDWEEAEYWRQRWLSHPVDSEMECAACRSGLQKAYFNARGMYEEALAVPFPVDPKCNQEPAASQLGHAVALGELGRGDEATPFLRRAIATQNEEIDYDPIDIGTIFRCLALGGQLAAGLDWLRDQAGKAFNGYGNPGQNRHFYLSLVAGLNPYQEQFAEPADIESFASIGDLYEYSLQQARQLAEQFDQRLGHAEFLPLVEAATKQQLWRKPLDWADASPVAGMIEELAATPAATSNTASAAPGGSPRSTTSLTELTNAAEGKFAAADFAAAAPLYLQAAVQAKDTGQLTTAGTLFAEAAQCTAKTGAVDDACDLFAKAWDFLTSDDASAELLLQVFMAWAQCAGEARRPATLLAADEYLQANFAEAISEIDNYTSKAEFQRASNRCTLVARQQLTHATLLQSLARDLEAALAAAKRAQHIYQQLGIVQYAAQTALLLGVLYKDLGQPTAAIDAYAAALAALPAGSFVALRNQLLEELVAQLKATGNEHQIAAFLERYA